MLMNIFEDMDIGAAATFVVSALTIIGFFRKITKDNHKKMMDEVLLNRQYNQEYTEQVKNELVEHTRQDDKKFDSIDRKFEQALNILNRTDEKVTLLINNKIK